MKFEINLEALDIYLSKQKCVHTFKHSFEWAKKNGLPKEVIEELANELDVSCDCKLAEILADVGESFTVELKEDSVPVSDSWMIPPDFVNPPLDKTYYQLIVSPNPTETTFRCYTRPDEILIPAPKGYKPSKKMRKDWHFFMGLSSKLPSEVGVVKTCPPITAPELLEKIQEAHLAGFQDFNLNVHSFT